MTAYIWIGRKLRHAHGIVGERAWEGVDPDRITLTARDGHSWMDNDSGGLVYDAQSCACGYAVCAKTGPCAPPPPPPKGELPEGWSVAPKWDGFSVFAHPSGACVEKHAGMDSWNWFQPGEGYCNDPKPTRAEAMAAALASLEPALPEPKCFHCNHRPGLHPDPISAHAFMARAEGCICMYDEGDDPLCAVHRKPAERAPATCDKCYGTATNHQSYCPHAEPELRPGWVQTYEGKYVHPSGEFVLKSDIPNGWLASRGGAMRWYETLEAAQLAVEVVNGKPAEPEPKCSECGISQSALNARAAYEWISVAGKCFPTDGCVARQRKPAEPGLRPGWVKCANRNAFRNQSIYTEVIWASMAGSWMHASQWENEYGFATAEAAMERAELLAAQRGAR